MNILISALLTLVQASAPVGQNVPTDCVMRGVGLKRNGQHKHVLWVDVIGDQKLREEFSAIARSLDPLDVENIIRDGQATTRVSFRSSMDEIAVDQLINSEKFFDLRMIFTPVPGDTVFKPCK